MNLDMICTEWLAQRNTPVHARARLAEAAQTIEAEPGPSMHWLAQALNDDRHKYFAAAIFNEVLKLPEELYEPMLKAAVYELNPLHPTFFVDPCIKSMGPERVSQTLIDYLEHGTNFEKAGAVNALHWANERIPKGESGRHKAMSGELYKLTEYRRVLYMKTFIENTDVEVRRSILTHVDLNDLGVSVAVHEMLQKIIKIARAHPDEYIRNRVEVQLGRSPSVYPLPARKRPDSPTTRKTGWWKQLWK